MRSLVHTALIPVVLACVGCDPQVVEDPEGPKGETSTTSDTDTDADADTDTDADSDADSDADTDTDTDTEVPADIGAHEAFYEGGAFVQLSELRWVENNAGGSWSYTEFDRDEWSVYMSADDGRSGVFQLDFWTREVKLDGAVSRSLVDAPEQIDGFSATQAMYSFGSFACLGDGTWVENNVDGLHTFEELFRDEWSVYLWATDRDYVIVQLDYWLLAVFYSPTGDLDDRIELFPIDEAKASQINGWVAREVHSGDVRYTQEGTASWTRYAPDGSQLDHTELGRDEWSVYLETSADPGAVLQLDLWTLEVKYYPAGGGTIIESTITDAW